MKSFSFSLLNLFITGFILQTIAWADLAPNSLLTFYQPDESSFTGYIYGDEIIHTYETEGGYTFVRNPIDHFYYYAEINAEGDLVPGPYKVGEVDPAREGLPQHLFYTGTKLEQLMADWQSTQSGYRSMLFSQGTLNLGLIFIKFQDTDPDFTGYEAPYYEEMFFSVDGWYDNDGGDDSPHPDEEAVFGSFNDYYQEVSYGNISVTGRIVNDVDGSGYIVWLEADHNRTYYETPDSSTELLNEALAKASAQFDTTGLDRFGVIYEGQVTYEGALRPRVSGNSYIMGEKNWGSVPSFAHIGIHCHEFGHTIDGGQISS